MCGKMFKWLLQKRYMYYIVEIVKSYIPTNVLFQVWNRYPHAGVSRSSFSGVPYIWRRNGNFIVVDVPVNAIYHFNLSTEMKYFLGCHYLFGITVIYIGHLRLELRLL